MPRRSKINIDAALERGRIRCFPAAPERQKDVDLVIGNLAVQSRERLIHGALGLMQGREHGAVKLRGSAVTTPTWDVAACKVYSARRTSGRRARSALPSPIGIGLLNRGSCAHCATAAENSAGGWPVSTARRYSATRLAAWSGGMLARTRSSSAAARVTSSEMLRP
jgi:hypothetical protein